MLYIILNIEYKNVEIDTIYKNRIFNIYDNYVVNYLIVNCRKRIGKNDPSNVFLLREISLIRRCIGSARRFSIFPMQPAITANAFEHSK